MILNTDSIIEKIKRLNILRVKVWDGHSSTSTESNLADDIFHPDKDNSTCEDVAKMFEKWAEKYPGSYTVALCASFKTPTSNAVICKAEIAGKLQESKQTKQESVPVSPLNHTQVLTQAQMMAQIEQMLERKIIKSENAQLKEQVAGYQTAAGKFGLALEHLFTKWFMPTEQAAQGSIPMNGAEASSGKVKDLNKLEQSFTIILDFLGEETVNKIAAELQTKEGQEKFNLIKGMING